MFARRFETIQDACDALLEADQLTARALSIIGSVDIEATCGLPAEMMLALGARRSGADAKMLVNAAATLRAMPYTASAFADGSLSWSQVRSITLAVRTVDAAGKSTIDELIGRHADGHSSMDPDEMIARVYDAVACLRTDLARAREDRQIAREYLSIQGRLDGSSTLTGEMGPESTATLVNALDVMAEPPTTPDEDGPTRPQQHAQALLAMAEHVLNGDSTGTTRPRPRLIATIDVESLAAGAESAAARILWSVAGRPARMTPLSAEVMACDASVVPVIFNGARPVAVGDATAPISPKLRAALIARDGRCRFPACGAPVAWCDAHHIRARIHDGPTTIDNLVLLCRRCHRRIHRGRWRITLRDDGVMEFTDGRYYAESPPHRERRE